MMLFDFEWFIDLMVKYMKFDDLFELEFWDVFWVLDKDLFGFVFVLDLWYILMSIGEKFELVEFDEWV